MKAESKYIRDPLLHRIILLALSGEFMIHSLKGLICLPVQQVLFGMLLIFCLPFIRLRSKSDWKTLQICAWMIFFNLLLNYDISVSINITILITGLIAEFMFKRKRKFLLNMLIYSTLIVLISSTQSIIAEYLNNGMNPDLAFSHFLQYFGNESQEKETLVLNVVSFFITSWLVGLLIGYATSVICRESYKWIKKYPDWIIPDKKNDRKISGLSLFAGLFYCFVLLLIFSVWVHAWLNPEENFLPESPAILYLTKTVAAILGWRLLVAPLIFILFKKTEAEKKHGLVRLVRSVNKIPADLKRILIKSWRLSENVTGYKRLQRYCKIVLINFLISNPQ